MIFNFTKKVMDFENLKSKKRNFFELVNIFKINIVKKVYVTRKKLRFPSLPLSPFCKDFATLDTKGGSFSLSYI